MRAINELLNELSEETKIKLRVIDKNDNEIFNNLKASESKVLRNITVNGENLKVYIEKDDVKLIPLVEYIINKSKIEDRTLEKILEGKKQWENLLESKIINASKMILVETSNMNEVIDIINETYSSKEIYVGRVYERIAIIGEVEEEEEYCISLKETILQNLGVNSKFAISKLDGTVEGFKKAYKDAKTSLKIGRKFKIKPEIYYIEKMFLEKAIYNLKEDYSIEMMEEYKDIFKGFNYELIQTLEEILNCNLSLTRASKNLFVHRNTLMYRIEKIKKETGFDIRDFKEATFLYMIYIRSEINYKDKIR